MNFGQSVKMSGSRVRWGEKKTMLARRNQALVTHIVNSAFDEGCSLQINGSRKRFVKLCIVELPKSFEFIVVAVLKN